MDSQAARSLEIIANNMIKIAKVLPLIVESLDKLTETTREGYEGPIRLLTELEEGVAEAETAAREEDDLEEVDERDRWRLG